MEISQENIENISTLNSNFAPSLINYYPLPNLMETVRLVIIILLPLVL